MTERNQVWAHVRPLLSPYGRFDRVENPIVPGMPDVNACVAGCEFWFENKVGGREGTRPPELVLEQVLWIERQWAAQGRAYLLVLYERPARTWCLYDDIGTRELWDGAPDPQPIMRAEGKFPTVEFLRVVRCRV